MEPISTAANPVFALGLDLPPKKSRLLLRELHRQLREAILAGRLRSGLRLPSTRDLAAGLGVSRNTAIAAYDLLLAEGYLTARRGAGTFVAERSGQPPPSGDGPFEAPDPRLPPPRSMAFLPRPGPAGPFGLDLRLGLPDKALFPFDAWRRLSNRELRRLAARPAAYLDPAGPESLRVAIASHVSFTRAVACRPEDVIVTAGAQQAFDILARTFIRPGRNVVAVEDPGYPPLRAAFAAAGAEVRPVPVDAEGLTVGAIPEAAAAVCVTPSHQFPTGVAMSPERRHALLDFARRTGSVIVEDDYDGEFRHGGRPLDALQTLDRNGSVFYCGTFSKSLFPALRLGFLIAPAWARAALLETRRIADWHGSALPQLTLAGFIEEGHLMRHIRRMRRVYAARRESLLAALAEHCRGRLEVLPSEAGLHLAARTVGGANAEELVRTAAGLGIALEPLARYALTSGDHTDGIALAFANAQADAIAAGIERLGDALRR